MLHIHGGSHLLQKLEQAGIPGDRLEWCDVLCQGPTPSGLSRDAWYALRAAYLSSDYPDDIELTRQQLAEQDARLAEAAEHDEVVLWFGPELFCQTILVRLLT